MACERGETRTVRRRVPAWLLSLAFHACVMGVAAALMPVLLYHRASFGPPIQVVQRVETEERVLPRFTTQVEMPPAPSLEVVLEPVAEPEAAGDGEPLAGDVLVESAGGDLAGAYPVCAVGLRTRPSTVRPVAVSVPGPRVAPPVPPAVAPVARMAPVPQRPGGPSCAARVLGGLEPRYPERQRSAGRSATVLLLVHIDESGRPDEVELLNDDVHPDFARAAISAAKKAKYEPALAEGRPVSSALRVRVQFRLQ